MSANDEAIHLGLGASVVFDLEIEWPSGVRQRLAKLAAGKRYVLAEQGKAEFAVPSASTMFVLSPALKDAKRVEEPYNDFAREPLLPNKLSQLGPGMAWGDVTGDGIDELFIGGSAGHAGSLYQIANSGFRRLPFNHDTDCEDMAPLFLDVDADQDLDLLVVSGGVERTQGAAELRDRLYLNDGKGNLARAPATMLPDLRFSASVAAAADYDRDGDVDVFIGARVVPGQYPESSSSVLLRNQGGRFVIANELTVGLVTSALWSDVDNDGWLDLLITREWDTVALLKNRQGTLTETQDASGSGWWNGITSGDLDRDGDIDYVVTNAGLNTKYTASKSKPVRLYYGDMDGSGRKQIVEAKVNQDNLFPVRGKSCSQGAMPIIKKRFPTFESFATATLAEIYTPQRLEQAQVFETTELRSGALINDGKGSFTFRPLPRVAQIAPSFGCVLTEVDGDGCLDLYLAQNFHGPQPETGRMDGGVSQLLLGNGDGTFRLVAPKVSGLMVPGDATSLTSVDLNRDAWVDFIVATNDGPVFTFLQPGTSKNQPLALRFLGSKGNPQAIGARISLTLTDGTSQTVEVSAGGGYLSQHSAMLFFGLPAGISAKQLAIRWPDGEQTVLDLSKSRGRRLQISHPSLTSK